MSIEAVEKWLTLDEVAQELGISAGKVRRLIEEHTLFSIRRDKQPMVPANLIVDGEPLSSIRGTLFVLLDSRLTIEEAIEWLYTYAEELGSTPVDALISGKKAPVRRLAQTLGS